TNNSSAQPWSFSRGVYPIYRQPRDLSSPRRDPAMYETARVPLPLPPPAPAPSPPAPSEELLRLRNAYQDDEQLRKIGGRIEYLCEPYREWPRLKGEVSQVIPG